MMTSDIKPELNRHFVEHGHPHARVDFNPPASKLTLTPIRGLRIWARVPTDILKDDQRLLKVHKNENFLGSYLEFYTISLLVLLKY
jgi:hypothetical protein